MLISPGNSAPNFRASRVHRFSPGLVRCRAGLRGAGISAVHVLRGEEERGGEDRRDIRDEYLKKEIMRSWGDRRKSRGKYGARKMW